MEWRAKFQSHPWLLSQGALRLLLLPNFIEIKNTEFVSNSISINIFGKITLSQSKRSYPASGGAIIIAMKTLKAFLDCSPSNLITSFLPMPEHERHKKCTFFRTCRSLSVFVFCAPRH
jgi:hypothetical protein